MTTTPSRLTSFRERKDQYYGSDPHSPLSESQRTAFTGMRYYDERPDLVFELPIDTSGEDVGEHLEMPTSDGQAKHYVRSGRIRFEADGQLVTLTVFKDVERGRYFLPFRDGTSGKDTYGAGRYLDPKTRPDGTLVVDFNYAYNPYCAYGEGWSCPIPPLENFAKAKIEAGERRFHDDD